MSDVPPSSGGSEPKPKPKPFRLFVAIDLPGAITDRLQRRVGSIRVSVPGARWTDPGGWHVTLKFLGWTPPEVVPAIEAALRSAARASEPFASRLSRVGAFPAPSRARVLWAGLDDADGRFARLVERLDALLAQRFEPERRAFAPHLTLARVDPPVHLAPEVLGLDVVSEAFVVDRMILYRSHLSPKGAVYESMAAAVLGSRPGSVDA